MTANGSAVRLYSPEILALAVELANFPITEDHSFTSEMRSRSCGSTLTIGLSKDVAGAIDTIGLRVSACAVGQASAAIFARNGSGQTLDDLRLFMGAMQNWLSGTDHQPNWPELERLEPARAYPGRHEAILLPWRAALAALSKDDVRR